MINNGIKVVTLSLKFTVPIFWEKLFWILTTLLTFNTLFIPFDKLILPIYIFLLLLTDRWLISKNTFSVFIFTFCYILLTTVINFGANNLLVFYPLLFVVAAILASRNQYINLKTIQQALLVNIFVGLIFFIAHYLGIENSYTNSLAEKGIPFLVAAMGFSPTVQVYGTCCILWLLMAFEDKHISNWLIFIGILALVITLNRVSLLFLLLLLLFYRRKIFFSILMLVVSLSVIYWDALYMALFNVGTLSSRVELRKGAEISYWHSNDGIVWLFGRASHQTSDIITSKTIWDRAYIENGVDFILHSYGAFGMLLYLILLAAFLKHLIIIKQYKYAIFVTYYFTFLQFLTNEFLSSTLFFFVVTIMLLSNKNLKPKSL